MITLPQKQIQTQVTRAETVKKPENPESSVMETPYVLVASPES